LRTPFKRYAARIYYAGIVNIIIVLTSAGAIKKKPRPKAGAKQKQLHEKTLIERIKKK